MNMNTETSSAQVLQKYRDYGMPKQVRHDSVYVCEWRMDGAGFARTIHPNKIENTCCHAEPVSASHKYFAN
jgi:hypothetical protein